MMSYDRSYTNLLSMRILIFLGQESRSRISGSYGQCIFNIFRNCRTVFRSTVPHPELLHFLANVALLAFLILVILVGVWCYLIVLLICIFPMTDDVENLFMGLLAIARLLQLRRLKSFSHLKKNLAGLLFTIEL